MKIELADFQQGAVEQMIGHLRSAQREVRENPDARQAICLTAPTGAGKTVIMSAVIEAMLAGEGFGFDDGPAVLWMTDSPELNEQSRLRLSSHIDAAWNDRIETIEESRFDEVSLPRGVWFLNTQKLGAKARLANPGDRREHTFWETAATTVHQRPGDLILVIDEAHRGMSLSTKAEKESRSIVQRFIRGHRFDGGPMVHAVPLLVGVTATPQRFRDLLKDLKPRRTERVVDVPPTEVLRSGLLKRTIRLRHVGGSAEAGYTQLQAALTQHELFMDAWRQYTSGVEPVMLIQVEDAHKDSPSRTDLDAVVNTVRATLGGKLRDGGLAHAFQEPDGPLEVAGSKVRHLRPSQINGDEHVQVVLFKTALSTGWDCPRAEVMMSFRSARDETAIAQLVGRMVRAPMRREIPGSELLNGVDLYLPRFDAHALDGVVARLRDDASDERTPARVIVARDLGINPAVGGDIEAIRAALADTPTYEPAPQRRTSDVRRLANIARRFERTASGTEPVLKDASEIARDHLVDKIVTMYQRCVADPGLQAAADGVLAVEQRTVEVDIGEVIGSDQPADSPPRASTAQPLPIGDRDLNRLFDDLNTTTGNGLLRKSLQELSASDTHVESRRQLQAELLALFRNDDLDAFAKLQRHAQRLIKQWHTEHRDSIEKLPDSERDDIEALLAEPGEAIRQRASSGKLLPDKITSRKPAEDAPPLERHVYTADADSSVQLNLNGWEQQTVDECLADPAVVAWLHNERTSGRWRLAVPYRIHDEDALMYPDFVFFRHEADKLKVDVVDPHGLHLSDALEKLHGLANYAQQHRHATTLGRVVAIAEVDGRRCERDLSDPNTSAAALACRNDTDARRFFVLGGTQTAQEVRYRPPLEDRDDPPAQPRRRLRID